MPTHLRMLQSSSCTQGSSLKPSSIVCNNPKGLRVDVIGEGARMEWKATKMIS